MGKKPLHILLIDDDSDYAEILNALVEEFELIDAQITWQPNVEEALNQLLSDSFDLIIVDFHLGEQNGIDILEKAEALSSKKPFILMTGQGNLEVDERALKAGATEFLDKKNLNSKNLERAIRYSLRHLELLNEIRNNELKYRNLFEKSIDPILLLNKKMEIVDCNSAALELLACIRRELLNRTFESFFASNRQFEKLIDQLDRSGMGKDLEVQVQDGNNEIHLCLLNATSIFNHEGAVENYHVILHDITERRKIEKENINFEKLAISGKIARTVAHEVRNPLTNVNLSLEQLKSMVDADAQNFLDIIKRGSDRIADLVDELLNSSRPIEYKYDKHDIFEVIDESVEIMEDRLKLVGCTLSKHYFADTLATNIDKEQLKTAFVNILVNAMEVVPKGQGKIRIDTAKEDNLLCVSIADNGPGVPQEIRSKLFDPFFSKKKEGLGLGLTTTLTIIRNHNGRIQVSDSEMGGAKFVIQLKTI